MVYNNFGESFYIKGADITFAGIFIGICWPWLMPLMFLIAGTSSAYALKKRTTKEYAGERVSRLLIPLLFGILLLVPLQTYFAEVYHNGYTGGYFQQYILFFTKPTDLSGYNGGFTPAHLWFILYLFIISMFALPLMGWYEKSEKKLRIEKITLPVLIALFIIPVFSQIILDIEGKSVGEYLTYFLFGYFLISNDVIQEKLGKYRFLLLGLALPGMAVYIIWGRAIEDFNFIPYELLYSFYAWTTILAILGLGKRYLNFTNRAAGYLSEASFSIYIFHQQWVVITAFFAILFVDGLILQILIVIAASYIFTFINYEIFKRLKFTGFMFGIKTKREKNI